ncbi:hypothetical protein JOQ06_013611 [Pogonophryne albipinna]|uniref:HECT domain-containing protein n=1 Tax=Pogonophryne albipinna TaxID=1090488 RepID=A0AAD6BHY8_9TELE|nr:hypothetical protein JOQ06_013611 [Pogonophryne albipinna]
MKSDIGVGKPRRRRMADDKEMKYRFRESRWRWATDSLLYRDSSTGNTVDQNMAMAFPGLFKSGKSYTPSPKRRALRSTPIQFFLLNKCTERTPKSSDEMVLLQAGLGRRTLNIPENADHSQISYILMESYSKMVPLEGAWMLHKAAGGSGQRKLSVLVPEAEGYTGAYLAKALGGKGCLYIMPIQDTLDTSPLPYSSKEFENMPKARCATCHLSMPVQLLALHAQDKSVNQAAVLTAWIWNRLAEAIETLSGRVDTTTLFNVSVTREDIFERGFGQWRRQKRSSPKKNLQVSFIGESGIDHGALRKEFLTEMMAEHFKTAGEIMAVSIVQGGPPPNFFRDWCYGYVSTGEMDRDSISKEDVTDPELSQLMEELEIAEPEAMYDLLDRITACGYSGPATWERKEEIIKAIILHSSVRILPMLQQICSGMKLYGLCEMIVQQPHNFRDLFVPGLHEKPDAEFLMGAISPVFSELGSLRRQRESRIINFLQDFIQNIEDEEEEKSCVVEERGTPVKITESDLDDGDSRETESTACAMVHTLYAFQWLMHAPTPLPFRHLGSYLEFLSIITQAVMSSREFSRS